MRRGEIFNLKWSNIDFDYGFIELLETKSGKSRKIPLSKTMLELLNNTPRISEFVFVNKDTGNPYTDIKHGFSTVLEKADIQNFRFHDLRHTVATRLVEKGIDLVVVKEILGHSKIETTMRYAHAVPKRKLEAIEVLNVIEHTEQDEINSKIEIQYNTIQYNIIIYSKIDIILLYNSMFSITTISNLVIARVIC